MTVASVPLLSDQQLAYYYPEAADESLGPQAKVLSLIAAGMWGIGGLAVVGMMAVGLTIPAILTVGALGFVDSLMRRRVSVYALIGAICVFHLIGLVPGLVTVARLVGAWALILSAPRLLRSMDTRRIDPIFKWVVLFVILGVVSFPLSPRPLFSLLGSATMVQVYLVPAVMGVWLTCRRYRNMGLMVLVGFTTLLAVQQIRTGSPEIVETYRRAEAETFTESAKVDINEMARLMSIGVFSAIYLFLSTKGMVKKGLCVFFGMVLCIGIVIGKSRACYVAVPMAVMLGILMARRAKIGKRLAAALVAVFLTVVVFFVSSQFGFLGIGIKQRFDSIFEQGIEAGARNVYWSAYVRVSAARGFMPYGLQGMRFSEKANLLGITGHVAHNDMIDILAALGLPGLVLFLGIHGHLFRRIRRMRGHWEQMLAGMFWIFMLTAGMTQMDFLRKYYGLVLGLLLVMIRIDEKDRRVEQARLSYSYALAYQQTQGEATGGEPPGG
ncbi:hypothetical protein LCGC14_0181280 [marine sediment metagenome]|uniref:O-antigen ligase-related domain-containing protein n=1 Tax=marine sediment metagenome TaxID=412755 RepID=A0A0F9UPJ1_9ZZZZ|nr:hypothetical protein [Phycisphaerae bacterium]HDZ44384.1 hypothetical protein [Phycisphaerae bacterium]